MALKDIITIPPEERNRESGIRNIGAVPWGTHLCSFYDTKQDLIDILVPYFKAGLENNEFCIWVTSEVLSEKEAEEALRKAVPDFTQYLERGQIEIIPYTKWYLKDGVFNRQRVLNAWIDKLNQALARGYNGMRVTGDTAWLRKRHWRKFTDYEEEINNVIGKYRMIALCTYPLGRCGASEVIDVMSNHQSALIRQAGNWVLTRSSEHKRAEEALRGSEEQHRAIFEQATESIVLVDADTGALVEFNSRAHESLGYNREEFEKLKIPDFEVIESAEEVAKHIEKIIKEGSDVFETKHRTKGGEIRDIQVSSRAIFIRGRTFIQSIWRDITESKRAEEALREDEEKLKSIFHSVTDGIVVTDLNGNIVDMNEKALQLGGFDSKNDLIGKNALETIAYRDRERALGDMQELIQRGVVRAGEYTLTRADGSEYPAEISADVLKDANGNPVGFVSVIRDISERKEAAGRPLTPLQERFVKSGLEGFNNREAIELLLSLCPGDMPEQVSEECLKVFQNIRGILSATPQELRQAGLPPLAITYIKLLRDMPAQVLREKIVERPVFQSSQEIFDYLNYSMRDLKKEVFKVIYLNKRDQIIDTADLFEGTLDSIPIHPREIIETAIQHNTAALIFVHNHPTGDPSPSKTDRRLTRDLVFIGNILQIRVLDHIIIGENRYFSFADEGLIQKYEDDFLNIRIRRI